MLGMSAIADRMEPSALKVLLVASECAPYAKCGGLGDVVASLPKALRQQGVDARIVMPLYASCRLYTTDAADEKGS